MADPCWCLAETNTILESNYPSIKKKKPECLECFCCISLSSFIFFFPLISNGECLTFRGGLVYLMVDLSQLFFAPSFWHTICKCFVKTYTIRIGKALLYGCGSQGFQSLMLCTHGLNKFFSLSFRVLLTPPWWISLPPEVSPGMRTVANIFFSLKDS